MVAVPQSWLRSIALMHSNWFSPPHPQVPSGIPLPSTHPSFPKVCRYQLPAVLENTPAQHICADIQKSTHPQQLWWKGGDVTPVQPHAIIFAVRFAQPALATRAPSRPWFTAHAVLTLQRGKSRNDIKLGIATDRCLLGTSWYMGQGNFTPP